MNAQPEDTALNRRHRVVVIGSGFGGLNAVKKLKRADVDIKLIARTTHHLFQPMLYQVATGIVAEGAIAPPTRDDPARTAQRPGSARRRDAHRPEGQSSSSRSCSATATKPRSTA